MERLYGCRLSNNKIAARFYIARLRRLKKEIHVLFLSKTHHSNIPIAELSGAGFNDQTIYT